MKSVSRYRWFVFGTFFVFMLLHQADKLLIGPLTPNIMKEFSLTRTQMGAVSTGALIVGAIFTLSGGTYTIVLRAQSYLPWLPLFGDQLPG
jgi:nitrate/nitrite transporter NarK